jgi:hypothetical protein
MKRGTTYSHISSMPPPPPPRRLRFSGRLILVWIQIKAVVINRDLEVKAEAQVHFDSMLPEYRYVLIQPSS